MTLSTSFQSDRVSRGAEFEADARDQCALGGGELRGLLDFVLLGVIDYLAWRDKFLERGQVVPEKNGSEAFAVGVQRLYVQAGSVGLLRTWKSLEGPELVDGHKRVWVAQHAGLDTVAVRVRDIDDRMAAKA